MFYPWLCVIALLVYNPQTVAAHVYVSGPVEGASAQSTTSIHPSIHSRYFNIPSQPLAAQPLWWRLCSEKSTSSLIASSYLSKCPARPSRLLWRKWVQRSSRSVTAQRNECSLVLASDLLAGHVVSPVWMSHRLEMIMACILICSAWCITLI